MPSAQTVSAYCPLSMQHYRLTLASDGRTVVNFTLDSGHGGSSAPSDVSTALITAPFLRACPVCGSRRVSGCDCAYRGLPCEPHLGFRFPCLYCSKLRISAGR